MAPRRPRPALGRFGVEIETEDLYWRVHGRSGQTLAHAADELGWPVERLRAELAPIVALGAVQVDDADRLQVPSMTTVFAALMDGELRAVQESARRMRELAGAVPFLMDPSPVLPDGRQPLGGHRRETGDPSEVVAAWLAESAGELIMLRPDRWRTETAALDAAIGAAIAAGRTVRVIYPARIARDAPEVLERRGRLGERVRLLPEVDTHLAVLPLSHALVPTMPGYETGTHLVVRERGLVMLLAHHAEQLWRVATPATELDPGARRDHHRRMLLRQLAAGGTDEQIARSLGVSLRTVRRRVAVLLEELGADSRFQAGVEATRRGWL